VIGLGMMGRPMAVNILNSGAGPVHITGRSRDRYSDLVAAGLNGTTLLGRSPAR
jgi:3-hydroxyisobutyrate dehydrogenase-like beta-hydroxyacid dehydrogenase